MATTKKTLNPLRLRENIEAQAVPCNTELWNDGTEIEYKEQRWLDKWKQLGWLLSEVSEAGGAELTDNCGQMNNDTNKDKQKKVKLKKIKRRKQKGN